MGQSNNPDGTAKVSDRKLIETLRSLLEESDKLAVPARDVAERVPIKKQAAGKRLAKLVKTNDTVARFKGSQAWLYYIDDMEESEIIRTEIERAGRGGKANAAGKRLDEHGADMKAVHEAENRQRYAAAVEVFGISVLAGGAALVVAGLVGVALLAIAPASGGVFSLGLALLITGFAGVAITLPFVVYRAAASLPSPDTPTTPPVGENEQ